VTDREGGPGSSAVHVRTQSGKRECIFVEDDMRPDGNGFNEADERLKAVKRGNALQQAFENAIHSNLSCWHLFRHTIASILLSNATIESEIEEIIGWRSDSKMVRRYAHLLSQRKRKALEGALGITDAQQNVEANV